MPHRFNLSMVVLAALVAGSAPALAQDQNNAPIDPTAPSGGMCTGFPGDPANCPREDGPNNTAPDEQAVPDEQNDPDINTQSGPEQTTPDENNSAQQPNGASPDNGAASPPK